MIRRPSEGDCLFVSPVVLQQMDASYAKPSIFKKAPSGGKLFHSDMVFQSKKFASAYARPQSDYMPSAMAPGLKVLCKMKKTHATPS